MSDVQTAIERAEQVVADLCMGRAEWVMHIPARPDRDPDLVISHALHEAKKAIEANPLASIPIEARGAIADWLEGGDGAWLPREFMSHLPLIASALRGDPGSAGSERA